MLNNTKSFKPTNLATCHSEERTYYKDLPTGRCFANKECTIEIREDGKPLDFKDPAPTVSK